MRPSGEIRNAILGAALELVPPTALADPGAPRPTMREMAHLACVGVDAASQTVKNMTRAGQLRQVGVRRVDYCNRPVAVYEPNTVAANSEHRAGDGWVDLGRIVGGWAR